MAVLTTTCKAVKHQSNQTACRLTWPKENEQEKQFKFNSNYIKKLNNKKNVGELINHASVTL